MKWTHHERKMMWVFGALAIVVLLAVISIQWFATMSIH